MTHSTLSRIVLAAMFLLALSSGPALAGTDEGAESPQALIAKLRAASETEDFGRLAALLAPEARLEMAQGLWAGATFMVAMSSSMGEMAAQMGEAVGGETEEGKAKAAKAKAEAEAKFGAMKKRYDEVAKKHGMPTLDAAEEQGDPASLFAKADLVALIGDYGALLKSLADENGAKKATRDIPETIENLKIEGDQATGKLGGGDISFVKIDGRWFIAQLPQGPGGDAEEPGN